MGQSSGMSPDTALAGTTRVRRLRTGRLVRPSRRTLLELITAAAKPGAVSRPTRQQLVSKRGPDGAKHALSTSVYGTPGAGRLRSPFDHELCPFPAAARSTATSGAWPARLRALETARQAQRPRVHDPHRGTIRHSQKCRFCRRNGGAGRGPFPLGAAMNSSAVFLSA